MRQRTLMIQACLCLAVFAAVQTGLPEKEGTLGDFFGKVSKAVQENYTLAELLNLGDEAAETVLAMPAELHEAVLSVNEDALFGIPLDEDSEETVKNVYAAAGGKVLRSGISKALGMYVTIEHPGSGTDWSSGKISTYGHLSDVRVVAGERVTRGGLLGSYDSASGQDFYYSLEDKSGNPS